MAIGSALIVAVLAMQSRLMLRGGSSPQWDGTTLEALRSEMSEFAGERDWDQFHQPRNLLLALMGEVGELSEIFQWRGDEGSRPGLAGWSESDKVHLGEELSDVLLYLIRLADRCGVDLGAAARRKMDKNRRKYPADLVRGSSAKYTAYKAAARARGADGGGGAEGGAAGSPLS